MEIIKQCSDRQWWLPSSDCGGSVTTKTAWRPPRHSSRWSCHWRVCPGCPRPRCVCLVSARDSNAPGAIGGVSRRLVSNESRGLALCHGLDRALGHGLVNLDSCFVSIYQEIQISDSFKYKPKYDNNFFMNIPLKHKNLNDLIWPKFTYDLSTKHYLNQYYV